jgi:hypothetical protein
MPNYVMNCSCGDEMKIDAADRDEAVAKLQSAMTEPAIQAHMEEKHPGEEVPTVEQIHDQIAEELELETA